MPFTSSSPLHTALLIVVAVGIIGVVAAYVQRRRKFDGYEEFAPAAQELARGLKAEITRDGPDLVVTGKFQGLPTFVRFSNSEHAPGLTIHMRCQASFGLSVTPANVEIPDLGRNPIRSGDSTFDQRFTIRTDQPTQARLLLNKQGLGAVQKLCCSNQTYLNVSKGEIELSELTVPTPQTASHIWLHVQSMHSVADVLHAIPGAESIRVPQFKREHHLIGRAAIALGAIAAVIFVLSATKSANQSTLPAAPFQSKVPAGMMPNDAILIKSLAGWRVANISDLSAEGAALMRSSGYESGRIPGDFSGIGKDTDVAYLLVNDQHQYRVVLLSNRAVRYDFRPGTLAAIGRIPRDAASNIAWNGPAPENVKGDGLLLVTNAHERSAGIALFFTADQMISATPEDYQSVVTR